MGNFNSTREIISVKEATERVPSAERKRLHRAYKRLCPYNTIVGVGADTFRRELLAGFPTPRPPAEISNGLTGADVLAGRAHIVEDTGLDVTEEFLQGAVLALQIAKENHCAFALLTDGSPS